MKKAFESKSTLWVKMGTQNRLENIKEEDDDLVLESMESEDKPISTATPVSFDPIKARSIRAQQVARGTTLDTDKSNWKNAEQRKKEDENVEATASIR